ncbi:MAG TPA: extracellular solute-binding protein [Mycobacteriales bacterium]|nr:extracellular solute-binding protein [Mycobacteriales bacterium]
MRISRLPLISAVLALVLAACGGGGSDSGSRNGADPGTVHVLYAGSLVNLMEHDLGPAFEKASGGTFQGYGGGSSKIANEITGKVRRGDVFISASPKVNDTLGPKYVGWYGTFATAPLLLGYNPRSKFAHDLKTKPWNEVITEPGIRVGRTDPELDPKGKLTVQAFERIGAAFATKAEKSVPVLPEEDLVGRLQAGQLDAAFFYSSESTETKIPTVDLGPVKLAATYTVTVLKNAENPSGGADFVKYLLGPNGRRLLQKHGLKLSQPTVTGAPSQVPEALRKTLVR